jgi:hypothetical protein
MEPAEAITVLKNLLAKLSPPLAELLDELPPAELAIALLRIAPMPEATRLSSLSEDTLEREHADKVVHLSARRKGMRVIDALMLASAQEQSPRR